MIWGWFAYRLLPIAYRFGYFLAILALLGLAQAQDNPAQPASPERCEDKPYTLETPQGLAGGGNLEYDGDVALFSDGACLKTKGILLQAPSLRYDQAQQQLEAQDLEVQTNQYRFWAERGTVAGKVLRAEGIRATTCQCGDNLRLLAERLSFDTDSGNLIFEQSQLQVYRFSLARFARLEVEPDKPLSETLGLEDRGQAGGDVLALLPVRFDFDQGLNVGVEEFPIVGGGEFGTRFPIRLTLMGLNLGSPAPGARFGFSAHEGDKQARFLIENSLGMLNIYTLVTDGPVLFTGNTKEKQFAFGLHQPLVWEGFRITPFGHIAKDDSQQGFAIGAEVRYPLEAQDGPLKIGMEPFVVGAIYEKPPGYVAYGTTLQMRFAEPAGPDPYAFELRYRWSQESMPGRFWLERRDATNLLWGSLSYQGLSLQAEYDFLNIQTKGSFRYGYRFDFGEVWAQYNLCLDCVGKETDDAGRSDWERRELVLGVNPNPLDCTYTLSLTPIVGYDFLRQSFSRLGLTARYADCCFIWKFGYEAIIIAQQPGEKATGRLIFGLEIR